MKVKPVAVVSSGTPRAFTRGISAADLMAKKFEPLNEIVKGLLVEGLTILGGKPKVGKSWFAYDLALAVPVSKPVFDRFPVMPGDVLYLALEDSDRRLRSRLVKKGVHPPERLTLATEWPNLDNGCIGELEAWADSVPHPVLVIVDVLKMVRGSARANESLYDADYRALTGLAAFARSRHLSVVVVHHVRKMESDDPLESLSGTNGLTGAADTVMVLKREKTGQCLLYVRGRDVEENELAVRFRPDNGTWELLGAATEVAKTDERQQVLDLLRRHDKPLKVKEVSDILDKNYDATRKLMSRMWNDRTIEKVGSGSYHCPISPVVRSDQKPDTGQTGQGNDKGKSSRFPHGNPSLRPIDETAEVTRLLTTPLPADQRDPFLPGEDE